MHGGEVCYSRHMAQPAKKLSLAERIAAKQQGTIEQAIVNENTESTDTAASKPIQTPVEEAAADVTEPEAAPAVEPAAVVEKNHTVFSMAERLRNAPEGVLQKFGIKAPKRKAPTTRKPKLK